jgi:hypothetical protein
MLGEPRRFSVPSTAVLVVALAVLSAWVTRRLAPPSHLRDGKRLPVDMSSQHALLAGHHGSADAGGQTPPSPVSDAPLAHFLGASFLALFVLAIVLVTGVGLLRALVLRFHLDRAKFAVQLLFAVVVALAAEAAVLLAAWLGYGDRLGLRAAFVGGIEAAQYAFVAALVVVVIFGVPLKRASHV